MDSDSPFFDDPEFIEEYHRFMESGVRFYNDKLAEIDSELSEEELERTMDVLKTCVPFFTPREVFIISTVLKGVLLYSAFHEMADSLLDAREDLEDPVMIRKAFEEMFNLQPTNKDSVKARLQHAMPIELGEVDSALDPDEVIRKYGISQN